MSIKLQILLNFRENVSWKCAGSHTCWSARHPEEEFYCCCIIWLTIKCCAFIVGRVDCCAAHGATARNQADDWQIIWKRLARHLGIVCLADSYTVFVILNMAHCGRAKKSVYFNVSSVVCKYSLTYSPTYTHCCYLIQGHETHREMRYPIVT